jgi:ribosomal-protein-alanine N-acetyltransferase
MKTATANQLDLHIRWGIRRDMPEVERIESHCFAFPWCEDDFIKYLRQRNCMMMVAEHREQIVGFYVYELQKHTLNLLNFAVHEAWRFKGVGRQMVRKLITKLSGDRRSKICVLIRETNVDAQLFFRAMGFKCVQTIRNAYDDTEEDGYDFRYRYVA